MKTPKEYTTNIKNGIITEKMLSDCLYSVNKRAKNYRDKGGGKYFFLPQTQEMHRYYTYKEQLLAFLEPICIHRQYIGKERVRVYSTEPEYRSSKHDNKIVHTGSFYDYEKDDYVQFFDYETDENHYLYFLYYEVADKSFHTPIHNPNDYNLEILKIQDDFTTKGENPKSLMSPQFVVKVLETLYTKKCQLILESKTLEFEDRPTPEDEKAVIEKKNHNITERQEQFIKKLCEFYDEEIPQLKKKREASKWISEFLSTHDYTIDKRKHDTLDRYKNIFKDHENGLTMDQLIEKYGVKKPTIKKAIKIISEQN